MPCYNVKELNIRVVCINSLDSKIIVITGGAGFIGSHLVKKILSSTSGTEIRVVDNFKYGSSNNIEEYINDSRLKIFKGQIGNNPDFISEFMNSVDYVFHLAAEKHNQSLGNFPLVLESNVVGTDHLFRIAAKNKVKKIIFSSSLYSSGKISKPMSNESETPSPTTLYGISKLSGEYLLKYYCDNSKTKGDSLRFYFVYGSHQYPGTGYKSVIIKNFQRIMNNEEPTIFGSGEQVLDYIHVSDVVEAMLMTILDSGSGRVFNISSGKGTSINDLVQKMILCTGAKISPSYIEKDWTDGTYRVGDSSLFSKSTGWSPKTDINNGLRETWEWLQTL